MGVYKHTLSFRRRGFEVLKNQLVIFCKQLSCQFKDVLEIPCSIHSNLECMESYTSPGIEELFFVGQVGRNERQKQKNQMEREKVLLSLFS